MMAEKDPAEATQSASQSASPKSSDRSPGRAGRTPVPTPSHPLHPHALRQSTPQDRPHRFQEHTFKAPTFCRICDGLLVGLWSQGHRCRHCGMAVHRGQGAGEHDDCRAAAMMTPCPRAARDCDEEREGVKLGDVLRQIHALAKDPNFARECLSQADRDVKSAARSMVVATAVDRERGKKLRRLKGAVVPLVRRADATAAHGDLYVLVFLLLLQAAATVLQVTLSFVLFAVVLAPRHGVLSRPSFQLASIHGSTVTAALHTVLAIVAAALYRLSSLFQQKNLIIDQFFVEALKLNAEADVGVSVAGAAERCKYWSERALASSLISMVASFLFWQQAQPLAWEAARLPPVASLFIPAAVFTLCSGVLAYIQGVGCTSSDEWRQLF